MVICFALSGGIAVAFVTDCAAAAAPTAEASYLAQQLECVDKASSRQAADICRDAVRKAWTTDAGTEGGK